MAEQERAEVIPLRDCRILLPLWDWQCRRFWRRTGLPAATVFRNSFRGATLLSLRTPSAQFRSPYWCSSLFLGLMAEVNMGSQSYTAGQLRAEPEGLTQFSLSR